MQPDLTEPHFQLTNGDVKLGLFRYPMAAKSIAELLLAENMLRGTEDKKVNGPFGFDLSPVERVRASIKNAVLPQDGRRPNRGEGEINDFRRELIFATADATRREPARLVLRLYTALMERHRENAENPRYVSDGDPSAAGEYLLRCLAVQAAYENFASYTFIVEQFMRVVLAIKSAIHAPLDTDMLEKHLDDATFLPRLKISGALKTILASPPVLSSSPRQPLVAVGSEKEPLVENDLDDVTEQQARAVGEALAEAKCVILTLGDPEAEARSVGGLVQRAAADRGARKFVCLIESDHPGWAQTTSRRLKRSQVLKLFVPKPAHLIDYGDGRVWLLDGKRDAKRLVEAALSYAETKVSGPSALPGGVIENAAYARNSRLSSDRANDPAHALQCLASSMRFFLCP